MPKHLLGFAMVLLPAGVAAVPRADCKCRVAPTPSVRPPKELECCPPTSHAKPSSPAPAPLPFWSHWPNCFLSLCALSSHAVLNRGTA